ncbi:hypothetical protein L596_024049 [Steinernema carpocapsae]|uniref:Uncharacterized protein n=1 Tax=Steinernema carpocapsae TaxID=34508 RepID=A0A4U5MFS3_STECR|nr:hypothetical protein L596_024049 [Steinernema carpocapsae]
MHFHERIGRTPIFEIRHFRKHGHSPLIAFLFLLAASRLLLRSYKEEIQSNITFCRNGRLGTPGAAIANLRGTGEPLRGRPEDHRGIRRRTGGAEFDFWRISESPRGEWSWTTVQRFVVDK